jgi:hypothetical protein
MNAEYKQRDGLKTMGYLSEFNIHHSRIIALLLSLCAGTPASKSSVAIQK